MSRIVAMDCEIVEIENRSILERVTIVDEYGNKVLDEYVKPTTVTELPDYRSWYSGYSAIKKQRLENASELPVVRDKVANVIRGCILVGHDLQLELDALNLSHPESNRRDLAKNDTSEWNGRQGQAVILKGIYSGHDTFENAKACMELYNTLYRKFIAEKYNC